MSGPPRVDGFRRRVKRGKEGLGCVSLPPSGAHLPSPQQSRTVRSGQEPRQRSQTAEPRCLPYHLGFSTYARLSHRLSIRLPPLASVISVLPSTPSRCRSRLEFSHAKFASLPFDRSVDLLEESSTYSSEGNGSFSEDRVSRDNEIEDAPVAGVGGDGLVAAAMVMVVVVVVLVLVKKKKKKTAYIGGGNSSLLPRTGGGKATFKDRGDVVLAGTRRVFARIARKENFSTSHLYFT